MVGDILKFFRVARNLTQESVAEVLDISQSTYSELENGKLKIKEHQAERLAKLYDVNRAVFLEDRNTVINHNVGDHSRTVMNTEHYFEADKELFISILDRIDKMLSQMESDRKELAEERKFLRDIFEKFANK